MKKLYTLLICITLLSLSSCGSNTITVNPTPAQEDKPTIEELKEVLEEETPSVETPVDSEPEEVEEANPVTTVSSTWTVEEVSQESQKLIEEASAELETIFLQEDILSEIFSSE